MTEHGPRLITPVPGPESCRLAEELGRYESRNVTLLNADFPIFWERAEGIYVWDADGNRYVDWTSAFCVSSLGHRESGIQSALESQAGKLWHAMGDVHPAALKPALCRKLSEVTFGRWTGETGRVILCGSGFEAVEASLKTSWLHSHRSGVIAFRGGYHGLGFGATEVTGWPVFREPMRGILPKLVEWVDYPHCCQCPFGMEEGFRLEGEPFPNCSALCMEKIESTLREAIRKRDAGCVLVEPMLGRGGDVLPPRDFLPMLRRVCDETKTLLIFDEIYTGFHRTGRWFGCEWSGVVPDLVCVGKGLANGFPIAACVGRETIMNAWPASRGEALHTTTHLGSPLGCAMALASIEAHNAACLETEIQKTGATLLAALRKLHHPAIVQIRGIGLMAAVEFHDLPGLSAQHLVAGIMSQGLKAGHILLGGGVSGNILSLTPPSVVTDTEIEGLTLWLQEYLTSLPGSIS